MFIFTIFYTIVYIYKACVVSSIDHLQLGLAVLAHLKRSYERVKSEIDLASCRRDLAKTGWPAFI